MMKRVYVLVAEKNDAFLGIYTSEQEALDVGKEFRFETNVLPWNIIFPMDFTSLDQAIEAMKH